jgi:hypothetical protein
MWDLGQYQQQPYSTTYVKFTTQIKKSILGGTTQIFRPNPQHLPRGGRVDYWTRKLCVWPIFYSPNEKY